jgi:hypothetical protein
MDLGILQCSVGYRCGLSCLQIMAILNLKKFLQRIEAVSRLPPGPDSVPPCGQSIALVDGDSYRRRENPDTPGAGRCERAGGGGLEPKVVGQVVSVNACSIKGDVKEHFSPCTGGADIFRDIQPLSPLKTLVWCRAPGLGLRCSISAGSSSGLRRRRRFLKLGKRCGCTVSTMVLSEARGLVLFRVVRGGIGFTQRLGARHHAPTGV